MFERRVLSNMRGLRGTPLDDVISTPGSNGEGDRRQCFRSTTTRFDTRNSRSSGTRTIHHAHEGW